MSTSRPSSVFICHASQDKPAARDFADIIEAWGYLTWLDERSLLGGQNWAGEIEKAIQRSDVVLIVLSSRSVDKIGYVQREIRLALDAADRRPEGTIFLLPVRLDDAPAPERLMAFHWLDARDAGWVDKLEATLSVVTRNLGRDAPVPSPPIVVEILRVDSNPRRLCGDQLLTIDTDIRLWQPDSVRVWYGASLLSDDDTEYYDKSGDVEIDLVHGIQRSTRWLRIPRRTPSGSYRLIIALWSEKIGRRRLATLDNAGTVEVAPVVR